MTDIQKEQQHEIEVLKLRIKALELELQIETQKGQVWPIILVPNYYYYQGQFPSLPHSPWTCQSQPWES